MDVLSDVLDFIAAVCTQQGLNQNTTLRARLVVEELFTNSVHHGYQNHGGSIWLAANGGNKRVSLEYQDAAPAYNPLAMNDAVMQSMHARAEHRPVGGLGAILVANLADGASYRYRDGRNILELVFFDRSS